MQSLRLSPAFVLLGALALAPASALAQDKPKTATKPKPEAKPKLETKKPDPKGKGKDTVKIDVARIKADLASSDKARIAAALDELTKAGEGAAAAAPHVEALLKRGVDGELTQRALECAGALKQASSSVAVGAYVKHRAAEVRRAAAKALIKTKGPEAIKVLRQALRSQDAQVRGIAATGLGAIGAKEALDDLFNALAHSVAESAAAIGQLCDPKQCEKFAELTGKHQFDVMASGFDQILFRPEKEMSDDNKIKIVGRIRELGTKEGGKYLADVKSRWPENWSKRVKQALESGAKASGGGGDE